MPLFLITSLYDEGISSNIFCVVEAESKLAIAQHMLEHGEAWSYFFRRSYLEEDQAGVLTPEQLLAAIEQTQVDGDSVAQLRISKVTVQSLTEVNTNPFFRTGSLFSDFG